MFPPYVVSIIQERKAQPDTTMFQLKSLLSSIATSTSDATYSGKQFSICTTPYLISCDDSTGLAWDKMTKQQAIEHSSYPQIMELDSLDSDLFTKVIIVCFRVNGSSGITTKFY